MSESKNCWLKVLKRVELHAHTKMSEMDALTDPVELISRAAAWGHKAVAITDHGVVQAFPKTMKAARNKGIKVIYGMEGYVFDDKDGTVGYKDAETNHISILAASQLGIKNLYEIVSSSHIDYFYDTPRIPKSLIKELKDGLIIGSACSKGELYSAIIDGAGEDKLKEIAEFYDYLEIMPVINNQHMIMDEKYANISSVQDIIEMNKRVVLLGDELGKPVCATGDIHYLEENDSICRKVLKASRQNDDDDTGDSLFFRTTEEMLEKFAYLGKEKAYEVVVENTNRIADMIDCDITPIAKGKFFPCIENSDEILRRTCEKNAVEKYGSPLPVEIRNRLDRELDSIIGNGYSVIYLSAKMLVDKSNEDGYVVGSRGSVASSFAATMAGITDVNPLSAHYICPECKHLEWSDPKEYECGIDMPPKACPECGTMMERDGHSIPFETFLGFKGNKEPNIDLNFAPEYQPVAHKYAEEIFGHENVVKAGIIGTVSCLQAKVFTEKYFEERGWFADKFDVDRIANRCIGVKRATGQHPGGIMIIPAGHSITEFCPVQRPGNDSESDITTTHFDYHSIDENLLKMDIIGHDGLSTLRHLKHLTGIDPMTTPRDDPQVNSLFNGTDSLDIKFDDYKFKHGSYGIPEFSSLYVRQILEDTKPERFADLVRISGLSHGTNVWTGNAQELISKELTTIQGAICTRDDIMNYLINQGLPSSDAYTIMESVRKGRGLKPEQEEEMRRAGVEQWYIKSCNDITYLFPRAHVVAYVMMSYRIAYFKVHYPQAFYASVLSTKLAWFKLEIISQGREAVIRQLDNLRRMELLEQNKREQEIMVYEIVYEMMSRGYEFEDPDIKRSPSSRFEVHDGKVLIPDCLIS